MASKKNVAKTPRTPKIPKYAPILEINGMSVFDKWGNRRTIRPGAIVIKPKVQTPERGPGIAKAGKKGQEGKRKAG